VDQLDRCKREKSLNHHYSARATTALVAFLHRSRDSYHRDTWQHHTFGCRICIRENFPSEVFHTAKKIVL